MDSEDEESIMDSEDEESDREEGSAGSGSEGAESDDSAAESREELSGGRASARKKAKRKGKTGVCYLSRVPPHLKPLKLRHLLSQSGEVGRIYLAPEDPAARIRRKRAGGNTGKIFTEGWIEFVHKSDAKNVAAMLNGQAMDPRRRSAYHYDLWCIKYLRKFKWDDLTGGMAYKKAVREQRLAAEISAAKRERDFYLARVDQARAIDAMRERKERKRDAERKADPSTGEREDGDAAAVKPKRVRHISQRQALTGTSAKPGLAADVLAAVFGKSSG